MGLPSHGHGQLRPGHPAASRPFLDELFAAGGRKLFDILAVKLSRLEGQIVFAVNVIGRNGDA
jgi:hypothetical protein